MVYEARTQSVAWMGTDYSKHMHFRWKIKWRLEHLGALGIMGEYPEDALFCQLPDFAIRADLGVPLVSV